MDRRANECIGVVDFRPYGEKAVLANMEKSLEQLDSEIIDAHSRLDARSLAHLYSQAAERVAAQGDLDRAAFLFVNAYVWALDAGEDALASRARRILSEMGREYRDAV
jgi:hypothetical protein